MIDKIKKNKKIIEIALITTICILVSFYIIYKLSSSIFMVITGSIILLIGFLVKDPEKEQEKAEEYTQLTIFSDEVLAPVVIESKPKEEVVVATVKKTRKKNNNVIDIENTNSYNFDEVDKKIKKSKKVKA